MNSRKRVLAVFDHQEPDRVPCWCGASVEFWEKAKKELNLDDEGLSLRFRDDFEADCGKMAADEMTQKWWDVCMPCQVPLEDRVEGAWWADMEEVFHCD